LTESYLIYFSGKERGTGEKQETQCLVKKKRGNEASRWERIFYQGVIVKGNKRDEDSQREAKGEENALLPPGMLTEKGKRKKKKAEKSRGIFCKKSGGVMLRSTSLFSLEGGKKERGDRKEMGGIQPIAGRWWRREMIGALEFSPEDLKGRAKRRRQRRGKR